MRISIISDLHLGFGQNTEREEDSFKAFAEAVEKSLDCDLIILGGDMFDVRIPGTEVFTKAIGILKKALEKENRVKVLAGINKNIGEFPLIKKGIPVVGIAGNHERRVKGLLNPVEALERVGFLVYLHCNGVIVENDGIKIAIQGMSSVPDQYAEAVLSEWNPKPVDGCFNILLMHQSIAPFLYAPYLIPLEKVPRGFDLYINGHVHGAVKAEYEGKPFIIPGSLLPTQITKDLDKHTFCKVDVQGQKIKEINFFELENQRDIFYLEYLDENVQLKNIEDRLAQILKVKRNAKPIIKIVIGNNLPIKEVIERCKDECIVYYNKKGAEQEIKRAEAKVDTIESVNELGRRFLRENLKKTGLDTQSFETIFELLEDNKTQEAEAVLEKVARKGGNI